MSKIWTPEGIDLHNARVLAGRLKKELTVEPARAVAGENEPPCPKTRTAIKTPVMSRSDEVLDEEQLADDVLAFCDAQWPRWKILRARRDKPSTIPVGCQDDTVFASGGRVFLLELKKKGGKPDADQLIWHKELEMLGHKVHVIRSMTEFLSIVGEK